MIIEVIFIMFLKLNVSEGEMKKYKLTRYFKMFAVILIKNNQIKYNLVICLYKTDKSRFIFGRGVSLRESLK